MLQSGDAELLAFLKEAECETVPEGFYTTKEWGDKWKLSIAQAQRYIRKGVELGKMERRVFRINTQRGMYPTAHYKIDNPPNE